MMTTLYSDYSRDRIGWFFGLTGAQLTVLAVTVLPTFWAVHRQAWASAGLFVLLWLLVAAVTIIAVRGRSAVGWALAVLSFTVGAAAGWTAFRSRASSGRASAPDDIDLPGALSCVRVHDGPPHGTTQRRVAVIQHHAARTWAMTAALTHPGIGMSSAEERHRQGEGLSGLLEVASRTELIDEICFVVRTVPEDGAERDLWVRRHRRVGAPDLARQVNDDLAAGLTAGSVRTESFVTVVVPEARLAREARHSGGGVDGRARVLYSLIGELEAQLCGAMAMTEVSWLTSPELAAACRTGFAPTERASIIDALAARERDPSVHAAVPWAMAGPSGADPLLRHYSHDAWSSVSATLILPAKGALMGALAPVLTPSEAGERRSVLVAYPILRQAAANRQIASSEWAADVGTHLRSKAKMKPRAKARVEAAKAAGMDTKIATGNSLTRPYAVCTVTVAKTAPIAEYGRRLDASVRRAGFAPLRLDLAQDTAFAASTIPLGLCLTRRSSSR